MPKRTKYNSELIIESTHDVIFDSNHKTTSGGDALINELDSYNKYVKKKQNDIQHQISNEVIRQENAKYRMDVIQSEKIDAMTSTELLKISREEALLAQEMQDSKEKQHKLEQENMALETMSTDLNGRAKSEINRQKIFDIAKPTNQFVDVISKLFSKQ